MYDIDLALMGILCSVDFPRNLTKINVPSRRENSDATILICYPGWKI